jgi:hypothetical protein
MHRPFSASHTIDTAASDGDLGFLGAFLGSRLLLEDVKARIYVVAGSGAG